LHPQPGRLGYRDWVGLAITDADGKDARRAPAAVVTQARARLETVSPKSRTRLLAGGFDMDNMKARGFVESEMPLPVVSAAIRGSFEPLVRQMVAGAREVAGLLSVAVGKAESSGELPDADKSDRQIAKDRFWERTEAGFRDRLVTLPERLAVADPDPNAIPLEWFQHLRTVALALFDELVPLNTIEALAVERLVGARRDLMTAFNGFGKGGQGLYGALQLPLPEGGKKNGKKNTKGNKAP